MGKKNKSSKQNKPKNNLEHVEQKGGSIIAKAKEHAHLKGKEKNKKPVDVISKVVDEKKLEDVSLSLAKKRKKRKNKKGKIGGDEDDKKNGTSPIKEKSASPQKENGEKEEKIVKLSKREKNRVKSKMSKDIAMDGKSKLGLADPKLVTRQLNKLKSATEPLSKAKQRKLLLLEKLQKKLKKDEGTKTPNTSMNTDSSDGEGDTSGSSPSKAKAGGGKKEKSDSRKEKDKLFLFVGNLPANVTDDMIREIFKSVDNLEKIRIPVPKRKKSKRFAYIKLGDEESKQQALQLHGSQLGDRKITVLYSDKSKGKSGLVSANAKLNAERKAKTVEASAPATNGSPNKSKMKTKKNKKGKGANV